MPRSTDPTAAESAHFWRDPDLPDVDWLQARYLTHTFAPHTHDTYVIGVIEHGAEAYCYRGRREVAPAGSVVVVEPGELHTGEAAAREGWAYRTLYPNPDWLARAHAEVTGRHALPGFRDSVLGDPLLVAQFLAVHHASEYGAEELEKSSRLWVALVSLIRRHAALDRAQKSAPPAAIQRALGLLADRATEPVTLAELAAAAGLSEFHLIRSFTRAVGIPPHRYQIQRRIELARQLLAQGDAPSDVAAAVGFADQSHLNRHFKRILGITPGHYARQLHLPAKR